MNAPLVSPTPFGAAWNFVVVELPLAPTPVIDRRTISECMRRRVHPVKLTLSLCTHSGCKIGLTSASSPTGGKMLKWLGMVLAVGANLGCTDVTCETDLECSDGLYCNGQESCDNGRCQRGKEIVCDDGVACSVDECNEVTDRCEAHAPDRDEDGVGDAECLDGTGEPLGSDCDDADPLRYAGNREICDDENFDEDCDPTTFGRVDADGDGYLDGACCNSDGSQFFCGRDCDDSNAAVFPGMMICHPDVTQLTRVCQSDGLFTTIACGQQGTCFPQPNGTGVCVPF